jgi:putative addiction module component (TIGR02574 family)
LEILYYNVSMTLALQELKTLPIAERADLAQALWDSILEEEATLIMPESHRIELEKRLQVPNPQLIPWEEVKVRLKS